MRAVALGNFDGVHIAHQAVLHLAARHEDSVCLLFGKHPLEVLEGKAPERLLTPAQTEAHILACGIRRCVYLDFAAVQGYSPERFFEEVLLEQCEADVICCGFNYTFGKNKAGDVSLLRRLCEAHGMQLEVAQPVLFEGEAVSSSRIRRCVRSGEIDKANTMLGYHFFFESPVIEGKRLGRELGFPTINQCLPDTLPKPLAGVYASRVTIGGKTYRGLTNIGDNPTIGKDSFRSETYLFDFAREAYGETACVELSAFIRNEKKFESLQALRAQVLADIEKGKSRCLKQ